MGPNVVLIVFVRGCKIRFATPYFFIMNYNDILRAYKFVFNLPESEDRQNLLDVIDYVDNSYINHCEEIGYVAIEEIEEMEKETKEECVEILKDILDSYTILDKENILEQFKIKINGSDR